jgi:hypothetical protein
LIFAEIFQPVARLFSRNFCASGIPGKALRDSQEGLSNGLVELRACRACSKRMASAYFRSSLN